MVRQFHEPQVSIIIPTCNRPRYLKRAIESVLHQTFRNYEILVIQNGPIEFSKTLVRKLACQGYAIRYLYERKADPANARNIGLQAARSEYIAFLDDDDEWLPAKLRMQVRALAKRKDIGLIACSVRMMNDHDSAPKRNRHAQGPVTLKTLLIRGCIIRTLSSVMVRKSCIDKAGGFDVKFPIANDYDLYLRLAQTEKLWLMPARLVIYHQHGQNMIHNAGRIYQDMVRVLQKLQSSKLKWETGQARLLESALEAWQYLLDFVAGSSGEKEWVSRLQEKMKAEEQKRCLKTILKYDPNNYIARYHLSILCQKAGKCKEARIQAERILDIYEQCRGKSHR